MKRGLSRAAQIIIIVVIIIIIFSGGSYVVYLFIGRSPSPSSTSSSSSTTSTTTINSTSSAGTCATASSELTPMNRSIFVDDSQLGTPDSLDPQYGFFTTDGSLFTSAYQELVEYNSSDYSTLIPVIASSFSLDQSGLNYTFPIRGGVWFSNGDNITAASVWYSFERIIFLNAPSFTSPSNFGGLTYHYNSSLTFEASWGLVNAIHSVFPNVPLGTSSKDQDMQVDAIESVLNHFNPSNVSIQALMAYPHQAYVVIGDTTNPVNASNPGTLQVNMLLPYGQFASDIAVWWGAIIDPMFVNDHGGTQNNTGNNFLNLNGGPGTGPYNITSASAGYSQVVLTAVPHYWASDLKPVPYMIQSAHIDQIQINYGIAEPSSEGDFGANKAQLATVSAAASIPNLWAAYQYKSEAGNCFTNILDNFSPYPGFFAEEINTQLAPTNNSDVRLAIVNAINYTQLLDSLYVYNGTTFAATAVGPMTVGYSQYAKITPPPKIYTINDTKAIGYLTVYLNSVNEHATLANGTVIGNSRGIAMPAITLEYVTPITPAEATKISIITHDLAAIGIPVATTGPHYYSPADPTPANSPNILDLGWVPDWPDPVFQLLYQALTPIANLGSWVNNTYANDILLNCAAGIGQTPGCNGPTSANATLYGPYGIIYNNNQTQVQDGINALYQWEYGYAAYFWMPNPNNFFFVQPYVHGFWFNGFIEYEYNTVYYS